jgi:plastocyanin/uncharacterized membrane protein
MRTLSTRRSEIKSKNQYGRREFMGLLGAGATASVGLSGTTRAQTSPAVAMDNNYFDPVGLHVEPGTTVRFEIAAGSHSVTAYEDRIPTAEPFDSDTMSEGAFEYTFDTPGTYDYYCKPHKAMGMVGRIVVGEPGGPAEESQIPDGAVPDSETIVEQGAVGIDEFGDSDGGGTGEMKHDKAGMMNSGDMGWKLLMPVGFLTVVLSLVGGVSYWASRRGRATKNQQESPLAVLEKQFARGEIDEEEFQERREHLRDGK